MQGGKFGKLYNWYAINDPRGLAPQGWHIPNDEEWTTLETTLGGSSVAGGKMKEAGSGVPFNMPLIKAPILCNKNGI
ncbi:MAG: fibrobacter succinogenes major paralogous domain-containing protein [Saprospiraceae bacterium]|nr:fibrobacter succinogenes major paralogous domain-containing protein [Saprospiraceae bacterium]